MFTIIAKNGESWPLEKWQALYGLNVGGSEIGKHFTIGETSIHSGGTTAELLIRLLDHYRELKGAPVQINSLDRTPEKQAELTRLGYRTAKISPHVAFMAADVNTLSKDDTRAQLKLIRQAASDLNMKIRIGWIQYMNDGSTFIHIDVCPEYYGAGGPFNNINHPQPWDLAIEW